MSFINFIEKLRKKPRFVRVQIMWVTVVMCMIVIFFVWFWSLNNDLKTAGNPPVPQKDLFGNLTQVKEDIPSLWQNLSAGIGNVFNSTKELLKNAPVEITPSPSPSGNFENSAGSMEKLPVE